MCPRFRLRPAAAAGLPALGLALLSACGGGGGEDPAAIVVIPDGPRVVAASAGTDVNTGNYTQLAAPLVRGLLSGSASDLLNPVAADRATAQAAAAAPLPMATTHLGRTLLAWLQRLPDPARKQAAAVSTQTLSCALGGSLTITVDDADNNSRLGAGDRISVLASTCRDDASLPAASGGFSMTVNAAVLNGNGEPTALDVSASFQAFTLDGFGSMTGGFRLWTRPETAASTRLRLSFLDTSVTELSGTVVYSFDIDGLANASSASFEISGGLGIAGQTYALATPTRLSGAPGGSPSAGTVTLRDAAGDTLRVLARSATTLDLEFLPAGATTPTASTTGLLWTDFDS